eukprot:2109398-Pyramimonas_sp.AAC.1
MHAEEADAIMQHSVRQRRKTSDRARTHRASQSGLPTSQTSHIKPPNDYVHASRTHMAPCPLCHSS